MATARYYNTVTRDVISVVSVGIQGPTGPAGTGGEAFDGDQLVDYLSDTELYRAEADVGSLSSDPVWRIRHIILALDATSATTTWADGTETFDKIWDDRATYTYS